MPKIKIKVTQRCIDLGKAADGYNCPLGLAIQNMGYEPNVFPEVIRMHKEKDYVENGYGRTLILVCQNVPPEVKKFIKTFDKSGKVEPKEFLIDFKVAETYLEECGDFSR
jgi:hypothetical protein